MSAGPGWFPDPSGDAAWRWWDGTRWTEHQAGFSPRAQWQQHTSQSVTDEVRAARWARIALIGYAVIAVVQAATLLVFVSGFRDVMTEIAANPDDPQLYFPHNFGFVVVLWAIAPVGYVALAFILVWVYRAATVGQRLGIPARHSPGMAVGAWFIPIINLWWPCEALLDLLPREHPRRDRILWIWIAYIAGAVVVSIGVLVAFGWPPGGWAIVVLGCAVEVTALLLSRGVVDDVGVAHQHRAQELMAPSAG